MSEPKWTPGPWGACSRQGDDWDSVVYLSRNPNLEICQCFHGRGIAGKDKCENNARLISAAPELYEAAQLACLMFERKNTSTADADWMGDDEHEAWSALRAAMAKARGEAQ